MLMWNESWQNEKKKGLDYNCVINGYKILFYLKLLKIKFYKLKNVTHGELYLRFEWYFLSSNKIRLSHVIHKISSFLSSINILKCMI